MQIRVERGKELKMIKKIISFLNHRGFFDGLNDKLYLRLIYWQKMGKVLNLDEPKRFNEKLQWLKLYDQNPNYSAFVDKYEVKRVVANLIGEKYIIPSYGVWDSFEEIDFSKLPNQFVLKCTHDSGGLVICKDKSQLDKGKAEKKIKKSLKSNYYLQGREWPYKNVKPRVLAEAYMEDDSGYELKDYKLMCFEGEPKLIQVHRGRFSGHTQDYYDMDWNKLDIIQGCPQSDMFTPKPECFEEMVELTRKLAKGIHHVRIDWYCINGNLLFGEMTFFDSSGFDDFEPDYYNDLLGSWINLKK